MTEIIERLQEVVYEYEENIKKLNELAGYMPDFLPEATIKIEAFDEFIDSLKELITDFE